MANTYTQLYIQLVFAPALGDAIIYSSWRERLHKYMTGVIQNKGHKLIAINSRPDHLHFFIGMNPDEALSDLVRDVKRDSTNFVNKEIRPRGRFSWQEGYGAFSYCHSEIDRVAKYILNQEEHHRVRTFQEEYTNLLELFAVKYNQKFLFTQLTRSADANAAPNDSSTPRRSTED